MWCSSRGCRKKRNSNKKPPDRKSTRLNSSHTVISYAVFCLKKKKDVVVGRLHRDRRRELGEELVDGHAGFLDTGPLDALPDCVTLVALELREEVEVEPLRLAGLAAQVLLRLAQLRDLAMGELERLEDLLLGHLVRTGLDHRQRVLRADDDQVHLGLLALGEGRIDDKVAVDQADADGAHRAEERQRRE